jgi:peptide/nickel transport system substrate-binding protein
VAPGGQRVVRRAPALALAAALLFAGCGGRGGAETGTEASGPVTGGTVVVGFFSDLDGLNEFVSTDANATAVMEYLLYVPLLRWGENLEIEGRLARSWEFSEDRREITMQLRDDVVWHDGVPTTADDVKFSFDMFRTPELGYPDQGALRYLEDVEVLGPHEVRFRFSRAYADQLAHLRKVIMPQHLLDRVLAAEMEGAEFNRAPVGNGPFRFVRWKQQQEIVFEANPDFFDGRPWVDRVVIRVVPDQTALETALRTGQIDLVERLRYEAVGPLRRDPNVQVFTVPQRGYQFVGWNTRHPLFASAAVRRAMTLAIDRQRILDALVFGEGKVTAHPIMSLSRFYAEDIEPYPYDPDAARRLLEAEGWRDTDGDGVLDRDGKRFEFELVTNLGNRLREDTLVMIQEDLRKIGVAVVPKVREWSVFLDDIKGKRFEAFHMAWQTDFIVDPFDLFHSAGIEGKYNMGSYSNPRVDELIDAGKTARTHDEAAPFWHRFQETLHAEQPYTILYELNYSVGTTKRLRGVKVDVRSFLVGVEDWWITPEPAA